MICSASCTGRRWAWSVFLLLFGFTLPLTAQSVMPPPPAAYRVEIRYRLYAAPVDRVRLYRDMVSYLESVGFHKDPSPRAEAADPTVTRMVGTLQVSSWEDRSARVAKILAEPHVKELQLIPVGLELPQNPDARAQVQMELVPGYPLRRERLLADQVREKLAPLGFIEAVGYDHREHTRLVGSIPVGRLAILVQDLRYLPAGWLMPAVPVVMLPGPLRDGSPILVSEVLREPPAQAVPAMFRPPDGQEYLLKLSPEVRRLAGQATNDLVRLELIFDYPPQPYDRGWRRAIDAAAPGSLIEGRLGELVAIRTPMSNAVSLAQLPFVSAVRLPRPATSPLRPAANTEDATAAALRASGVERLHQNGRRGRGVRVAIVDNDFRGYEAFLGKKLPARVNYVDLTAARDPDLRADPFTSPAGTIGAGTQRALAAALAAPEAAVTLVRIDPAAAYQLETVARYINGENYASESFQARLREFDNVRQELDARQRRLDQEQRFIGGQFPDLDERKYLESKPEDKLLPDEKERLEQIRRYDRYRQDRAALERDERVFAGRVGRYIALNRSLQGLRGVDVVSCSLVWEDGYPLGGDSALSRYFDEHPFRTTVWLQSAGNARDQSWSGLFRDVDGNGVLEFVPVPAERTRDWWRSELNFLAWKPVGRTPARDLPAGVPVRVTLQWREAHDPAYARETGAYQQPLANLRILVLRQLDPSGARLPTDDFEVVAASDVPAQRLENFSTSATYEQSVAFTPDRPARYAIRIEGNVPDDIRPAGSPVLPGQKTAWELRPRLFVDVADGRERSQGRPVLRDFATRTGSIGVPGDSRSILTVSAAAANGQPEPYATDGPAYELRLLPKPDLLAFDQIQVVEGQPADYGSSLATAFAAGMAATAMSAGYPKPVIYESVRAHPGKLWRLP